MTIVTHSHSQCPVSDTCYPLQRGSPTAWRIGKQHNNAYHQEEQQPQDINLCGSQVHRFCKRHKSHRYWMEQHFTQKTDRARSTFIVNSSWPENSTLQAIQKGGLNESILCFRQKTTFTPTRNSSTGEVSQMSYNTQLGRTKYT